MIKYISVSLSAEEWLSNRFHFKSGLAVFSQNREILATHKVSIDKPGDPGGLEK